MNEKVVITGAGGFIGSHLVDFLLTKYPPSRLRLLVSLNDSLKNLPGEKIEILKGDIRNKVFIKKAVKDAEIIYHLAAYTGFESENYQDFKEVNVDGTRNILDSINTKIIKKFIFFSTIAVYGLPPGIGNIYNFNENQAYNPTEKYGRSKMEAEILIKKAFQKKHIPYAIIRPVSVYGPRDKGQIFSLYKAIKNKTFVFIGDGKNKMHYIYVTDLIQAAYLSQISKRTQSDYIIGDIIPMTLHDVVKHVARSIDVSIPKIHIPTSIGLSLGYAGLAFEKLTGISSPIFPSRVKVMTRTWYYDTSKSRRELHFKPKTDFPKGISKTTEWILKKKLI